MYLNQNRVRSQRNRHLNDLQIMILGKKDFESGMIRADDIPTEYIVIISLFLISGAGALVFWQLKKQGSALPMAGSGNYASKRMD